MSFQETPKEISHLNKELLGSSFELQHFLGLGSFGKVFKGYDRRSQSDCAIKVYLKGDFKQNLQEIIYDEANLLKSLSHPNIVKFYGLYETSNYIFLSMELIAGGSLKDLIESRKKFNQKLSEEELRKIASGIINAIRYLHDNGIVHRDLKPENILLANVENLNSVKIIDFGLSVKFIDQNKNLYQNCGTPLFIAPELKKYKIYSKPVDIWSFGIIFYELCTLGEHPFYKREKKHEFEEMEEFVVNIPNDMPNLIASLLKKTLMTEPSERYNAENIAQHPFITGKSQMDIPLTSLEAMQAFQNLENFMNITKLLMFCKYLQKTSPKVNQNEVLPTEKTMKSMIIPNESFVKKEKLKLNPIFIVDSNTPSTKGVNSKNSSCQSYGKKGLSPMLFHNSEEISVFDHSKTKKVKHLFSFNHNDLENEKLDVKKMISEMKETEMMDLVNESLHIETILEKNKSIKHKSALLRNEKKSLFKNHIVLHKNSSTQSEATDESSENIFLKNIIANDEQIHLPTIKSRIKSCYSSSPKKK